MSATLTELHTSLYITPQSEFVLNEETTKKN